MTARSFDGADDEIRTAIGNCSITGAISMMAIIRRNGTGYNSIFGTHTSGGSGSNTLEIVDNSGGSANSIDFNGAVTTAGITITNAMGWLLVGVTKPTGTSVYRLHKYTFSTKVWIHADAGFGVATGASAAGGTVRFGEWQDVDDFAGWMQRAAMWSRELTDAEVEMLASGLGGWFATRPAGLWDFSQAATGQALRDLTGGGADQTTIAGTTVDKDQLVSEPGWGFTRAITSIGGGTLFTQDVAGTLASAGAIVRQTQKVFATRTKNLLQPVDASIEAANVSDLEWVSSVATLSLDSTKAHSGTKSLKANFTGPGTLILIDNGVALPVTPGTDYTFSFYAQSTDQDEELDAFIYWYNQYGVSIAGDSSTPVASPGTAAWVRHTVTK